MDNRDPFKDLTFDGRPAGYRDFRRKVILGVAGLEDKVQHLAGPRLLQRLSGEAWRATEHLSISPIREDGGWLKVLEALDAHYKFLPETELHEAIDEFLFLLKRRANEGATAFTSRFRTQLARVESLITQERALARKRKRQRAGKEPTDDSSVDVSDGSQPGDPPRPPSHVPSFPSRTPTVVQDTGDAPRDPGAAASSRERTPSPHDEEAKPPSITQAKGTRI